MNECDKDCSRCTYASCIVDDRRTNRISVKLLKKFEKKKFFSPTEKSWFEKEYDRSYSVKNY